MPTTSKILSEYGTHLGKVTWLFVTMIGLVIAGCNDSQFSPSSAEDVSGVELQPASAAELDQVIQAQRGRVVLIDFWATSCGPCRRLFPHTVALEREYGDKGLSVLTVSIDNVGQAADVKRFLQQNQARTMNFIARVSSNADIMQFGIGSGIPFLKIYDRQGNLRETIEGGDEVRIDRTIRTLLAEK